MSVISFHPKPDREFCGWTVAERCQLEALFASRGHKGEVGERVFQITRHGDPQFFLLGPAPDHACLLSISRVAGHYVVENGQGGLIGEAASLEELARLASRVRLARHATGLVARVLVAWAAFRSFVEDRTEPVMTETLEVAEFLPHLAALA